MRYRPSRSVIIYSIVLILLSVVFYKTSKEWWDRGKLEKKMQQKIEAKEQISLRYYLGVYGPKALKLNSGLCIVLLLAGPWALRKLRGASGPQPEKPSPRTTLAVVAIAMSAAALIAQPRMHHSLWADEMTSMLKFMVGEYERGPDGSMQYDPVEADYRQFSLKTPNNHLLYSNVAGTIHQTFVPPPTDPQEPYFKEWVLRLPALGAALGAILSITWLAGALGFRYAGWLAALMLIFHPSFVRYAAEARGYSVIMACVPALFTAGLLAIRSGQWRWWIIFAVLEVVMMDTWPLAVVIVFVTNLTVGGMLLTSHWQKSDRITQFFRWSVISVAGAMAAIQLLLPCLPQIQAYMETFAGAQPVTRFLVLNCASNLFFGSAWHLMEAGNPVIFSWQVAWNNHPVVVSGFLGLLISLFAIGWVKLFRHSAEARWCAMWLLLFPLAILAYTMMAKSFFLIWYWVPAVPGVVFTIAVGAHTLLERTRPALVLLGGAALIGIYAAGFFPQIRHLREHPVQQNKEAAMLTRNYLNPTMPGYGAESLTGFVASCFKGYDNDAQWIEDYPTLVQLKARAESEQKPLFVNLARPNLIEGEAPEILRDLKDPTQFDLIATLYGHDYEGTRYVYRYRNPTPLPAGSFGTNSLGNVK